MRRALAFFNGIVFTCAFLAAAAFVAVWEGLVPAGADVQPPALERWAAGRSLDAAIARSDAGYVNPLQPSDDNLIAGVRLYRANCALCHGASDAAPSNLAKGMYVQPPQLAKDGVEDDPLAVTFWKLKHGIRFTAMPAFGATLSDDDLWKISMFVGSMDKLSPAVQSEWKSVPSSATTAAPSSATSPDP